MSVNDRTDKKTEPLSVKRLLGDRAVHYTYNELREHLYLLVGFMFEGAALKRLYKIANAKYQDIAAQNTAIHEAGLAELARLPRPQSIAEKNVAALRRDMEPQLSVKAGEPNPYLEDGRPRWSDRNSDQNVLMTDDKIVAVHEMSWRSRPIAMPLTSRFYGLWQSDGSFKTASIMADVRQGARDAEPQIAFERHGFKEVDGKVSKIEGIHQYTLTLAEAANLARGLLLLIDLATETDDENVGE